MADVTIHVPTETNHRRLVNGFAQRTTDFVGSGSTGVSITIVGNGVNGVRLRSFAQVVRTSLPGWVYLSIYESGPVIIQSIARYCSIANAGMHASLSIVVPAFTGSKTFYTQLGASAGVPTLGAGGTYPHVLEATWA